MSAEKKDAEDMLYMSCSNMLFCFGFFISLIFFVFHALLHFKWTCLWCSQSLSLCPSQWCPSTRLLFKTILSALNFPTGLRHVLRRSRPIRCGRPRKAFLWIRTIQTCSLLSHWCNGVWRRLVTEEQHRLALKPPTKMFSKLLDGHIRMFQCIFTFHHQ